MNEEQPVQTDEIKVQEAEEITDEEIKKRRDEMIQVQPDILTLIDKEDRDGWEYDQYVSSGQEVSKSKVYSQWLLGKLAHEVSDKFGDASKFARDIRMEEKVILEYRRIYRRYIAIDPNFVPDGFIPWGVLQIAARSDNPVETVNQLSDENKVSMNEAYRHVKSQEAKKAGNDQEVPSKPRVNFKFDEVEWKWVIDIPDKYLPDISFRKLREKAHDLVMNG